MMQQVSQFLGILCTDIVPVQLRAVNFAFTQQPQLLTQEFNLKVITFLTQEFANCTERVTSPIIALTDTPRRVKLAIN